MSKNHNHISEHDLEGSFQGTARLSLSILLNLIITIAEIIGGLVSGSLSLLSDALHNFSDTASLGISLIAVRISTRGPDRKKTFGYRRAQIIGALINLITLVVVGIYLIKEAIERYFNPQPILGNVMLVVAVIGLLANLATAALLHRQSQKNINIRSAFLHIMGDAFSSVGVVIAGVLITRYKLYLADTLMTLAISAYILYQTKELLGQTINILMQGVPEGMDIEEIIHVINTVEDVQDTHHVHVWQLDESQSNLEAHIVIDPDKLEDMPCIKQEIKTILANSFHIRHSTLEFELENCEGVSLPSCFDRESETTYVQENTSKN
jgi:cobalt-zinc-cadmium efflux system protein